MYVVQISCYLHITYKLEGQLSTSVIFIQSWNSILLADLFIWESNLTSSEVMYQFFVLIFQPLFIQVALWNDRNCSPQEEMVKSEAGRGDYFKLLRDWVDINVQI